MKAIWICLPLAVALNSCQPVEQGPVGDNKPALELQAGGFARTMIDNTSFFRQIPLSGGQADLLLQRHATMRVIQLDPGYSKVELDSGEVGFVMTAMLEPIPANQPDEQPGDLGDGPAVLDPDPSTGGTGVPDLLPPTIEP